MVKDKSKTLSSHSIPSSQARLHSFTPSSSSSFHLRHVGNGSAGLSMMVHLCCNFLCTLFPCCNVGFLPRDKVFNELLQHESSPQCTVLKIVPVWVPHGLQLLPENLLLYVFFLSLKKNVVSIHKSHFPIYHFQVSVLQTHSFLPCSLDALVDKIK